MPCSQERFINAIVLDEKPLGVSVLVVDKYTGNLPEPLLDQLITYSTDHQDIDLQRMTSDGKRFGIEEKRNAWFVKNRMIYTFSDSSAKLYGILWIGKEGIPKDTVLFDGINPDDYQFTYATRLYGSARGAGLGRLQMKVAFEDFIKSSAYQKYDGSGFWAQTSSDNVPVIKRDETIGFQRISEPDIQNKVIIAATFEALQGYIESVHQPH